MLLPGWREDTCTRGVSLHSGCLVQVVCLRLHLVCGLGMCGSLPRFWVFLFFLLIILIELSLDWEVFLWYLFISVTHYVGSKVHEVMTLPDANHGQVLLNSWSVPISQQLPTPHAMGWQPCLILQTQGWPSRASKDKNLGWRPWCLVCSASSCVADAWVKDCDLSLSVRNWGGILCLSHICTLLESVALIQSLFYVDEICLVAYEWHGPVT